MSVIKPQFSRRTAEIIKNNNLPTQRQLDNMEIRFYGCVITYKLKHIETQPCKSRWRKVGKSLGFSFRSLRSTIEDNNNDNLFSKCVFNPSDRFIMQEHIKNLETPTIQFTNCKFLRRDSRLRETIERLWRRQRGYLVKFEGKKGIVEIEKDVLRLKDLPAILEYIIVHSKEASVL